MMATCCIQPIDMVKVRIQMQEGKVNANPISIASSIIKNEGVGMLYRGLSAALLRQLTYGTTRLGVFQTLQAKLNKPDSTPSDLWQNKVISSLCAGGFGALVGTPADAALVRMQADTTLPVEKRRGYKNGLDAMIRMAREEGPKGFFSGAAPTVYRGLSINVGMLTSYDSYQNALDPFMAKGTQANRFAAGALSGWTAATVSLPFDFIKTRLQKQQPNADGTLPYKNFVDCARKVAAVEGPMAFYNGYLTYVSRITPHICLTWVFMDNIKDLAFLK
jgi:solute carrier family 25 oxoglutarate transporter 11